MTREPAIDDVDALLAAVRGADTNPRSHLHGEHHWRCVAWAGLRLARLVAGADREVVFLFAMFHDAQRLDDGHDADHGRRSARLVTHMHGEHFRLDAAPLSRLIDACAGHVDGRRSADPTIGVCWDADRLNLWRIGVAPRAEYLSTGPAREPEMIQWASFFEGGSRTWREIYDAAVREPG